MTTFEPDASPTTSVAHVLFVFAFGGILGVLLCAQGLMHSADSMDAGPTRSATAWAGRQALRAERWMQLESAWQSAETDLGKNPGSAPSSMMLSDPASAGPFNPAAAYMAARWTYRHAASGRPSGGLPALRIPSQSDPLRLLITGDSLTGYLGPDLVDAAYGKGPVSGTTDTHDGTGLTSPNFVDWSSVAQQQVAGDNPDAVVVMIGGNDFQNMVTPNGPVLIAGTPAWRAEYTRRAEVCMRIWAQDGTHRVYWLSVPPARNPAWAATDVQINVALRDAARRVPGARFLNVLAPVTNHGHYADFVLRHGQQTLVREPDGVHLNETGSEIVASEVLPVIVRDWHLSGR